MPAIKYLAQSKIFGIFFNESVCTLLLEREDQRTHRTVVPTTLEEKNLAEFYRMGDSLKDAILTIMKYIHAHTGVEPTQEEVAELLKSYFILNEVGNQIKYQLKQADRESAANQNAAIEPFWRLNLKNGPGQNFLARAGVFHRSIKEAIDLTRQHVKKNIGVDPARDVIASSLKSSFILSEIKSQIGFLRKRVQKKKAKPGSGGNEN